MAPRTLNSATVYCPDLERERIGAMLQVNPGVFFINVMD